MCLFCSETDGLVVNAIAPVLSVSTAVGGSWASPTFGRWVLKSEKSLHNQTICFSHCDAAVYSASAELRAISDWRWDCQKIDALFTVITIPVVDLFLLWHPDQFESTCALSGAADFDENKIESVRVNDTYFTILPPTWSRTGADSWDRAAALKKLRRQKKVSFVCTPLGKPKISPGSDNDDYRLRAW